MDKTAAGQGAGNQCAIYVEEAGGMITLVYISIVKAYNIMDKYFPDDEEADSGTGPLTSTLLESSLPPPPTYHIVNGNLHTDEINSYK
jgi:importin subunit alpha-6/7